MIAHESIYRLRAPFRPFTLRLVNGAEYRVDRPAQLAGNGREWHHFAETGGWTEIAAAAVTELISD